MSNVSSRRLGDLITLKRGYDLPEKDRVIGPYPVISSAGISGYHNVYKVDGQGVVTGRYGTLGDVYFLKGKYWPHNTALYVQNFKGNDPKYIYYLLSCLGRIRTSDKSAVPGVNRNELHEMAIPAIGDKKLQVAVRKVLEVIDNKVELNNRINAELEAMAKTLYDYWFIQFDFPDANGKPYKTAGGKMVYNPTLKRKIPEGWRVDGLSKYLHCNKAKLGKKHQLKILNYLDTANLTNNIVGSIQKLVVGNDTIPSRANMLVSKYDILYSTVRPNQLHYGIVNDPIDNMVASTGFAVLSHKANPNLNVFFYLHVTSTQNTSRLIKISESSKSSYPSISPDDILCIDVSLPLDTNELCRFCELVNPMFEKASEVQKENKELAKLRDWLLPMLMNGQVTVS